MLPRLLNAKALTMTARYSAKMTRQSTCPASPIAAMARKPVTNAAASAKTHTANRYAIGTPWRFDAVATAYHRLSTMIVKLV